jgi:hypothetical protein
MILPTKEIRDLFEDVYPRQEDAWLYPSYRLGLKTVLTRGSFHVEVPLRDPESVTAFNNGCLDGLELLHGRKELERSAVASTKNKNSTYNYSPVGNREYNSGF